MSDERIVEAVSDRLRPMWVEIPDDPAPVMRWVLAALRAEGFDIYRPDDCEPWLGCATTRQLIEELTARIDVLGQLDYSTVGGTPDQPLVPVGGEG